MKYNNNKETYRRANSLKTLLIDVSKIKRYAKNKNEYYNYPVAFDIETSSFTDENGEPRATMYIWQMCFGDSELLVYGRTWEEFLNFTRLIRKTFHLKKDRILVIYCHNLSYEIQWIRFLFTWSKIFALDKRVPLYMRSNSGLEFRCSYKLSNYSLETLAKNLLYHDIRKLVGNLDYKKIRHSGTPLTPEELDYCMYDVKIVCAYISERLEIDGNITKIPLTQTSYVRNSCKIACFGTDHEDPKYYKYRKIMSHLTMEPEEYLLLRSAFMGGYTHANAFYTRKTLTGVTSQDFTSSYPYVLFSEMYPWSKGELCYPYLEEVMKTLNTYAWILDLELFDIESIILQDDYLSFSRCLECRGYVLNNGRINSASYVHVVITSVDLEVMLKCYRFNGGIKIKRAYKYYLHYLPTDFINEMLDYYEKKTTLKGVSGKEEEYLTAKGRINSLYGMVVMNPLRPSIGYEENEWTEQPVELEKGINKYNKSSSRFMPYVVGVFVTAYARRNLWTGILAVGTDYVYSDTDSIKLLNYEEHKKYFDWYNAQVIKKLQLACKFHKIPFERVSPKTIDGEEKTLGLWDFDGYYTRFRTLGSKRYMTEEDGEISLTVSGLNKKSAIPYLLNKYGKDKIFDAFIDDEFGIDNLMIPEGYSGRMVATYIDEETSGTVTDYLGNKSTYHEHSSIHLGDSTYTLSLSRDYMSYLLGIRNEVTGNEIK